MSGGIRRFVPGANVARVLREKGGPVAFFRNLLALASVLLLGVGNAQTTGIDAAISNFQTEGIRLVGVVSAAGLAVIAAGVLMVLGWAMLRKVSGGK